ncbi:helicase [Desulfopila sp. IMCC35006]|uniref:helix-turn-helix domain-containing protein n=1 Tax=Desulfopila sp. IMCC35006 TaxID=2569542 RepID=UPI0010AD52AE|nr:helix-turn-helix domain-containing protein [Desulfopila sp. IMCC35006]TKB25107.1 helicase [Desulfopila sp. IMCC35006]
MTTPANPELQLADEFVRETGCNIYLTGKAGTGKTTFLHNLKKKSPKRMIVTAPTGVAAINAGGVTLHSFFQMPFGPFVPGSETTARHRFGKEKINIIKSLDLLVIDEISMVRADLLDGVDAVLRRYRRSSLPFGGVQLLLIGDLHQLSPVVKDADWRILSQYYDSPYFFSSSSLRQSALITIELQHIYRQEDDHFIRLLNRVRDNNLDQATLSSLNARHIEGFGDGDQKAEGYITLCTHNSNADAINASRLQKLSQKSHRFDAEIEGEFPEHSFPTAVTLEVKPQAQVMFVRNDSTPEKRFFNGKIGRVTRISGEKIWIQCPDDTDEIVVEPATWENIEYSLHPETLEITENKIGAFIQYPLKLAWAITIHKSQGLTFDRAIIDAQAAFAHGQVYVALSRCRTLDGMVLSSPLSPRAVKTDSMVLRFVEQAAKNMVTAEQLALAKIQYQQRLLLECFDFKELQVLLSQLVSLVDRNAELLVVLGAGDLHALRQKTVNEICTVGANFRRQLQGLFSQNVFPAEDPAVLERIQKASVYFEEKITAGMNTCIPQLEIETDNKEIRKKAVKLRTRLQEETAVKLAAVKSCATGFSAAHYLRAVSSAEIQTVPKKESARVAKTQATYSEADIDHPELFQTLREWRAAEAKEQGVPHFHILHQKTLIQIVVHLPDSLQALMAIKGIGKKLSERYGEELVAMVSSYRRKNNIEEVTLPEKAESLDQEPKKPAEQPAAAQTDTKKLSLELFEEGLTLPQIAAQRDLVVSTVEGHLAYFVARGELAIERLLPPAKQQAIEEKINQMPDKKMSEIKLALGSDYSYSDIRFVQAYLQSQASS